MNTLENLMDGITRGLIEADEVNEALEYSANELEVIAQKLRALQGRSAREVLSALVELSE